MICFSQSPYLGYTGYVTGNSKAIGMGGAFTGISDDVNCIYYNPAGFIFSDLENSISFNYAVFIDRSLDLDKTSENDIWKSHAFAFGMIKKTDRDNQFTWGIYLNNIYSIVFSNTLEEENDFYLDIGSPGEEYEIKFDLGGLLVPLIWRLSDKVSLGLNTRILTAKLSYQKTVGSDIDIFEQDIPSFYFDLSVMYKVSDKVSIGIINKPAMDFDIDETMNAQLGGINLFRDVSIPGQFNIGLGYRVNDKVMLGFDIHSAVFNGGEVLVGSNLLPGYDEYKVNVEKVSTFHLGIEDRTVLADKDLFLRAGFYEEEQLFAELIPRTHVTGSVSWRLIELPGFPVIKNISLGFSFDAAEKYDVGTITLTSEF
jgi:hypothetical protein